MTPKQNQKSGIEWTLRELSLFAVVIILAVCLFWLVLIPTLVTIEWNWETTPFSQDFSDYTAECVEKCGCLNLNITKGQEKLTCPEDFNCLDGGIVIFPCTQNKLCKNEIVQEEVVCYYLKFQKMYGECCPARHPPDHCVFLRPACIFGNWSPWSTSLDRCPKKHP